jgi:hypothetical protein
VVARWLRAPRLTPRPPPATDGMAVPPPPPPSGAAKSRTGVVVGLVAASVIIFALLVIAAVAQLGQEASTTSLAGPTQEVPTPSAVATPSPTKTFTPKWARREVAVSAFGSAIGRRLVLDVKAFSNSVTGCTSHRLVRFGVPATAYLTDCTNAAGSSKDPIYMYVLLKNRSSSSVTVKLQSFVATKRSGGSQSPIDVRGDANKPEAFIQPFQLVPPHAKVEGFLVFDGRIRFVPKGLSYVDGKQTLTVRFDGQWRP